MPFVKGQSGNPATQFKKGTTGNPAGRPHKLPELDVLLAEVLGEEKDGNAAAKVILMALRAKAAKGDVRAAEALLNRAYGMPKQDIKLGGEVQIPIIQIVKPE